MIAVPVDCGHIPSQFGCSDAVCWSSSPGNSPRSYDAREEMVKRVLDGMSTLEMLVLDGRGGGEGYCRACDRIESLRLSDCDGHKTPLGYAVLVLAKARGEI